jgi:hypothetical protein
MKRITLNLLWLAAFTLSLTAAGYSQSAKLMLKAQVPFEFNVGEKVFPAGEYKVARVTPETIALRDSRNGSVVTVVTGSVESPKAHSTPVLRFELEDGRYVLTQVWEEGATTGYQLVRPKRLSLIARAKN